MTFSQPIVEIDKIQHRREYFKCPVLGGNPVLPVQTCLFRQRGSRDAKDSNAFWECTQCATGKQIAKQIATSGVVAPLPETPAPTPNVDVPRERVVRSTRGSKNKNSGTTSEPGYLRTPGGDAPVPQTSTVPADVAEIAAELPEEVRALFHPDTGIKVSSTHLNVDASTPVFEDVLRTQLQAQVLQLRQQVVEPLLKDVANVQAHVQSVQATVVGVGTELRTHMDALAQSFMELVQSIQTPSQAGTVAPPKPESKQPTKTQAKPKCKTNSKPKPKPKAKALAKRKAKPKPKAKSRATTCARARRPKRGQ